MTLETVMPATLERPRVLVYGLGRSGSAVIRHLARLGWAGAWFDISTAFATLASTQSMLVVIGAGGSPAPPFQALFDDVYVREK